MNLDLTSQMQLYLGLFEAEIGPWLHKLSRDIRCAINIGAGYGEQTLYFLTKTAAQQVISFEPSAIAREHIKANLTLNGLGDSDRLELIAAYVGSTDKDGTCTLDSVFRTLSFPCIVMMDVDGGEVEILLGAKKLLGSPDLRWLIETHSKELEQRCIELLSRAGYFTKVVPNAWWRFFLPELRPVGHNRWLIATKSPNDSF
ncbi:MAG: hypothetical protein HY211_04080 [Candidatus Omnitrophica bacterium]|nr:hypothetical protein [Candidatus Omnitrophota bacterium]